MTVNRRHALGSALIYCQPEGGAEEQGTGSEWPAARPVVQNPRRNRHAGNLSVLTQFYPILPGLGS